MYVYMHVYIGQCAGFALLAGSGVWTVSPESCYSGQPADAEYCGTLYCQNNGDGGCYFAEASSAADGSGIQVATGTPCPNPSGDNPSDSTQFVCSGGSCEELPTPPECADDCNDNGECANSGNCVCDAGFTDATCSGVISECDVDCAALNRLGCVGISLCGGCLAGFNSLTSELNSPCELAMAAVCMHTP